MMHLIESHITALAHTLPLPWFSFFASFIEEIIVPIPSPVVMLTVGSLARIQELLIPELVLLILIAAVGKTCGALCVYWVADKAEDVVLGRSTRFFGVTRHEIQRLGARFRGTPRDYLLMIGLRSLPIMPSALISIGSGVLKLPLRLFLAGTFVGTLIRDSIYLYVGYVGTNVLHQAIVSMQQIEDVVLLVALIAAGLIVIRWILKAQRDPGAGE